jgi:hypothetical protein
VPFVQVYGVETEPVFWKFMSSVQNMGEDDISNQKLAFNYDNDDVLERKVSSYISYLYMRNQQEREKLSKESQKSIVAWSSFLEFMATGVDLLQDMAKTLNKVKGYEMSMNAYHGALLWMKNSNDYYKIMITGSKVNTSTEYFLLSEVINFCSSNNGKTVWQYESKPNMIKVDEKFKALPKTTSYIGYLGLEPYYCKRIELSSKIAVRKYADYPNDGLILSESAGAEIPLHDFNKPRFVVHLKEQNHSQMINSSATKNLLFKLYNGDYHKFFRTEKR